MTTVGFPDFQEQAQWQAGALMLNVPNGSVPNNAQNDYPSSSTTFNVSNWLSTQVFFAGSGSILDYHLSWFADAAGATFLGSVHGSLPQGSSSAAFVNQGPYLRFSIGNNSGSVQVYSLALQNTNRPGGQYGNFVGGPLIYNNGLSVPANSSNSVFSNFLYAGPALLWFDSSATNWLVIVNQVTSAGTGQIITQYSNGDAGISQESSVRIIVPPAALRLDLYNRDGVANTYYMSMTPDLLR